MTVSETSGKATPGDRIERSIEVQGISTHLFEAGDPAAPPLFYLHGTNLGNLWLPYHSALARDFHILAPDLPGYGLTNRPSWMRDMSDYILFLRDLLDALSLSTVRLVGHSLGGWMAAEMAVWYPERVEKLVLANSAGLRVKGHAIVDMFALTPLEVVQTCFEDFNAAAPLIPAEITPEYILSQYRQMSTLASLAWNPSYDPKLERRLKNVACPTLLIWGQLDRLIPALYAEAFQKLIPHAEIVKLEGTGHMPMFEQPEAWSKAINDFLR